MQVEESVQEGWGGEAESVLNLAPASSIPICYHSKFGPHNDLLLFEIDDKLLPDFIQNRVSIRGQPDEDAVLCTLSSTYAMKFVGTSNSVFLIPPGNSTTSTWKDCCADGDMPVTASVVSVVKGNIELIEVAPKLDKLKNLLGERPYNLGEDLIGDPRQKVGLYIWNDLVQLIQASEEELRAALKSLSAVEIDGYWRILNDKSIDDTLDMILRNAVVHDWPLNGLQEDSVLSVLEADGFPTTVVSHCLGTHGCKLVNSEGTFWSLHEKQVCLRLALRVLSKGKMRLESFMEKWELSIPTGMKPDLKMLEGEVLYEKIGIQDWIRAFSISSLPLTPVERFAALFHERPKWLWKDLEPYIRDVHVPGLSTEGLLIKYARRTQPKADAEPIFSAR